jgi:hypothetical protein
MIKANFGPKWKRKLKIFCENDERRYRFDRYQARYFKLLRTQESVSKKSIQLAYVAWRAGTITLFLLGS